VTWKIECTGEQKMTGTGSITYQGEESYKGESTFNMQDAKRGPMHHEAELFGQVAGGRLQVGTQDTAAPIRRRNSAAGIGRPKW
jgi:hypothetical protein